jgi:DNA-binding transcriptional LysR family regulator
MDLFELETFLAVVREGGFSRAAKVLHRTQPAISQTIRRLENDLGEQLLDRSSRDGTLTDAGRLLEEYALRMLNLKSETRTALAELRQLSHGKLMIAANEYTCMYLLPVLHEFRRQYPLIKIAVQRSLGSRISGDLTRRSAELGVLSFDPDDSALASIAVYTDVLEFVVHPKHPLAKAKRVGIKRLGAEIFVAHNVPSPLRARVLQVFQKHKTPLHMHIELPTIEAIKRFVAMGNGVALVPGMCVQAEVARGELVRIPLSEIRIERKLRIVYRKNASLSHAALAFLQVARQSGAGQIPAKG